MARAEPGELLPPGNETEPHWWPMASYVLLGIAALSLASGIGFLAGRAARPGPVEFVPPAPTVPSPVTVYLAGEIAAPGIYTLPAGSRLHEFVVAAGGLLPEADAQAINLATRVSDGQRFIVPRIRPTAPAIGTTGLIDGGRQSAVHGLNLNTASEAELASLPRIGPVTAAAIVQWRLQHGGFGSVEDLLKVRGIGNATLEGLRPYLAAP